MAKERTKKNEPLVTVLLPTYNRAQSLSIAIDSVLAQSHSQFELFVIRDGGQPVAPLIQHYDNPRIRLIDRDENRGKAASLNEALRQANGKYICYLDDDDRWYPYHLSILVEALEKHPEYGLAYSDLYKVHYRPMSGGRRQILAKNVEISRDFDRMLMLQFNHVLHVSLMHRRDLLDQAGPYNEDLKVLIDWDLTRRLCFYTDFLHVPIVTGEYYAAVGECDRISVQQRKDVNNYLNNLLTIRAARPPKPWPFIDDLSVVVLYNQFDEALEKSIGDLWSHSYYPKQICVPLPQTALSKLRTAVPNVVKIPVAEDATPEQKIDAVLSECQGDYIAIVPVGLTIAHDEVSFIERSLYPLIQNKASNTVYELVEATENCWGAVFRKDQLARLRFEQPNLSVQQAAMASGMEVKKPEYSDYPFQFDHFLTAAGLFQQQNRWDEAAQVYEMMAERYGNTLWMRTVRANALFQAGHLQDANAIIHHINQICPTPARLMIEARLHRKQGNWSDAVQLYRRAQAILDESPSMMQQKILNTISDEGYSEL